MYPDQPNGAFNKTGRTERYEFVRAFVRMT
jgi:hypothetical protein